MAEIPQTDVSRRAALPTASLLPRNSQPTIDQNSDEYLDAIEEEWNKKVDVEVDTLVESMVDLVGLASVCIFSDFSELWLKMREGVDQGMGGGSRTRQ